MSSLAKKIPWANLVQDFRREVIFRDRTDLFLALMAEAVKENDRHITIQHSLTQDEWDEFARKGYTIKVSRNPHVTIISWP